MNALQSTFVIFIIIVLQCQRVFAYVKASVFLLPKEYYKLEVYGAMMLASNQKIYIGTCTYYEPAILIEFDTITHKMNFYSLEQVPTLNLQSLKEPHAKIHTLPVELKDGSIVFGTHFVGITAKWGSSHLYSYPGGHWLRFLPNRGVLEDLGQGAPDHEGLITMAVDIERNKIYGLTWPRGLLVSFDIKNRGWRNLGRISDGSDVCRSMVVGKNGRVYSSFSPNQVFYYDPQFDSIRVLNTHLPEGKSSDSLIHFKHANWHMACWDEHRESIYAVHGGTNSLIEIDVKEKLHIRGVFAVPASNVLQPSMAFTNGTDNLYFAASDSSNSYLFEYKKERKIINYLGPLQSFNGFDILKCEAAVVSEKELYLLVRIHPYGTQQQRFWPTKRKKSWDDNTRQYVEAQYAIAIIKLTDIH